jgi:hypothetical protein
VLTPQIELVETTEDPAKALESTEGPFEFVWASMERLRDFSSLGAGVTNARR